MPDLRCSSCSWLYSEQSAEVRAHGPILAVLAHRRLAHSRWATVHSTDTPAAHDANAWLERELVNLDMGHVVDAPLCPPHRMRIEEANGTPAVWGRCRRCGYARMYNSGSHYEGTFWHNSLGQRYLP